MARNTERPPTGPSSEPKRRKKSDTPLREDHSAALNAVEHSRAASRGETRGSKEGKSGKQVDASVRKSSAPPGAVEKTGERSRLMPDEIRERFIGIGSKYY